MRATIPLIVGVMLLTPSAVAAAPKSTTVISNVSKTRAEVNKEIARNMRRDAPPQGPKSGTQPSSSKAK